MLVALVVFTVVGTLVSTFTLSETWLFAKNTSLNSSHTSVRTELDRLANELQRTQSLPDLIDTSGNTAAVSPAAGLQYDRLVGGPYVLTHPGGAGLSAGTTNIEVTRSTNPFASAPVPVQGDVLLLDTATGGTVRAQISASSSAGTNPGTQILELTLASPLASAVNWKPTQIKIAQLVRRQAFIVMPAGGRNELRFFQSFEPVPNLNDPTQYVVITNQVSTLTLADGTSPDATPFSIDTTGGNKLVKASLRVRAEDYTNSLAQKQADSFNTFVRIDTTLPSRLRPKS